ncbi:MAG: hypothetical protein NTW26_04600 [bacterium]|nr:hypothetical protein [bacterium]
MDPPPRESPSFPERILTPEAAAELEQVTKTVYEIVPVLLVLVLASFLTAMVLIFLKKE